MADKIQEPAANLKTKDQIKVKEEKFGKNVVEAQPEKEQKTIEPKEVGVVSPPTPKVDGDKIAIARIGSEPCFFTKPDPNSNETTYTKELVLQELLMKAINAPGPVGKEEDHQPWQAKLGRSTTRNRGELLVEAIQGGKRTPFRASDVGIHKTRDPYATATAVAEKMGYTKFDEGSAGAKKRDEIAESIEAKKAMAFPKSGASMKKGSVKARKDELDAAERAVVDDDVKKESELDKLFKKTSFHTGKSQEKIQDDRLVIPKPEQLGLKPETQLKYTHMKKEEALVGLLEKAAGFTPVEKARTHKDPFSYHQRRIARQTLNMPDAMVGVMGGPNKEEAKAILARKKVNK